MIDPALSGGHLAGHHGFNLIRKLRQNILLHAAQDERRRHHVQVMPRLLVALQHDGGLKPRLELFIGIQIARHQEIKDGPQLAEPILNRRSRQRKAMLRFQRFNRLRRLRSGVFDILRLIQKDVRQLDSAIGFHIALELVVGGHQNAVLPPCNLSGARRRRTRQCLTVQARRKPRRLVLPVELKRRRADDERTDSPPCFLLPQKERQCLNRFAQAHIVGKDAAKARVAQRTEPRQPRQLIRAQFGLQRFGLLCLRLLRLGQAGKPLAKCFGRIQRHILPLLKCLFQIHRAGERHAAALRKLLRAHADAVGKLIDLRRLFQRVSGEERPALKPHIFPLLTIGGIGGVQIRLRQPA